VPEVLSGFFRVPYDEVFAHLVHQGSDWCTKQPVRDGWLAGGYRYLLLAS
jgi:hypothetical protein